MGTCCSSSDGAGGGHRSRNLRPKNTSIFDDDDNASTSSSQQHVAPRTWRWERHGAATNNPYDSSLSTTSPSTGGKHNNNSNANFAEDNNNDNNKTNKNNTNNTRTKSVSIFTTTTDEKENNNKNNLISHPTIVDPQSNSSNFPTGATSSIVHGPGGLQDGEYFSIMISPGLAAAITNACKLVDDAEQIATTTMTSSSSPPSLSSPKARHHHIPGEKNNENDEDDDDDDQEDGGSGDGHQGGGLSQFRVGRTVRTKYNMLINKTKKNKPKGQTDDVRDNNDGAEDDGNNNNGSPLRQLSSTVSLPWPWSDTMNHTGIQKDNGDEATTSTTDTTPVAALVKNNVESCFNVFIGGTNYKKATTSSIGWSAYDLCLTCDVDYTMKERNSYSWYEREESSGGGGGASAAKPTKTMGPRRTSGSNFGQKKQTNNYVHGFMTDSSTNNNNNGKHNIINNNHNSTPARCVCAVGMSVRTAVNLNSNNSGTDGNNNTNSSGSTTASHHHASSSIGSMSSLPPVKTASSSKLSSLEQEIKVRIVESFNTNNGYNNNDNDDDHFDNNNNNNNNNQSSSSAKPWTHVPTCQVIARVVLLVNQGRLCLTSDDAERHEEELAAEEKLRIEESKKPQDFFKNVASPGLRTPHGSKLPDFENEHQILTSDNDEEDDSEKSPTAPSSMIGRNESDLSVSSDNNNNNNKISTNPRYNRRKSFNNHESVEGRFVGLESAHISNNASAQWYLHVSGLSHPYTEVHDAETTVLFESVAHPGFFLTVDVPNVDLRRFALPSMNTPVQWNLALTLRQRSVVVDGDDNEEDHFIVGSSLENNHNNSDEETNTNHTISLAEVMRERIAETEMKEIRKYLDMNMKIGAPKQHQNNLTKPSTTTATTTSGGGTSSTTTSTTVDTTHHTNNSTNHGTHHHHHTTAFNAIFAASALAHSALSTEHRTLPVPLPPCPLTVKDLTQSFRLVHTVIKTSSENVHLPSNRDSSSGLGPWQLPWFGANAVKLGVVDFLTPSSSLSTENKNNNIASSSSKTSSSPNSSTIFMNYNNNNNNNTKSSATSSIPLQNNKGLLSRPSHGIFDLSPATLLSSNDIHFPSTSFYIVPDSLFHVRIVSAENPQLTLAATGSPLIKQVQKKISSRTTQQNNSSPFSSPKKTAITSTTTLKKKLVVKSPPSTHHKLGGNPNPLSTAPGGSLSTTTTPRALEVNNLRSNHSDDSVPLLPFRFSSSKLEVALCTKSALKKIFNLSSIPSEIDGTVVASASPQNIGGSHQQHRLEDNNENNMNNSNNDELYSDNTPTSLLAEDASLWRVSFVDSACPIRSELNAANNSVHQPQHNKPIEKFNAAPTKSTSKENNSNNKDDINKNQNLSKPTNNNNNNNNNTQTHYLQSAKHIQFINKLFPGFCLTFSKNLDQWCLSAVEGGDALPADSGKDAEKKHNMNEASDDDVDDDDDDEMDDTLLQGLVVEPAHNFSIPSADLYNKDSSSSSSSFVSSLVVANRISSIPTNVLTRSRSIERAFLNEIWFKSLFNYNSTNHTHQDEIVKALLAGKLTPTQTSSNNNNNNNSIFPQQEGLSINVPAAPQVGGLSSTVSPLLSLDGTTSTTKATTSAAAVTAATATAIPLPFDTLSLGMIPLISRIGSASAIVRIVVFHKDGRDDENNNNYNAHHQSHFNQQRKEVHHQSNLLKTNPEDRDVENIQEMSSNNNNNNNNLMRQQSDLRAKGGAVNAGERCASPPAAITPTPQQHHTTMMSTQQREENYKVNDDSSNSNTNNNNTTAGIPASSQHHLPALSPTPTTTSIVVTNTLNNTENNNHISNVKNNNNNSGTTTRNQQHTRTSSALSLSNANNNNNNLSRPQSSLSIRSEISHGGGGGGGAVNNNQQSSFLQSSGGNFYNNSGSVGNNNNNVMTMLNGGAQNSSNNNRVTGLVNSQAGWILQWTRQSGDSNNNNQPKKENSDDHTNYNQDASVNSIHLPSNADIENIVNKNSEIIVDQLNNSFLVVPVLSSSSSSSSSKAKNNSTNNNNGSSVSSSSSLRFMLMHLASCTSSPVRRPMFLTFVHAANGVTLAPLSSFGTHDGHDQIFSIDL